MRRENNFPEYRTRDLELFDGLGPAAKEAIRGAGDNLDPDREIDVGVLLREFKKDWINNQPFRTEFTPLGKFTDPDVDQALAAYVKRAIISTRRRRPEN